jgi:hypothetical protein
MSSRQLLQNMQFKLVQFVRILNEESFAGNQANATTERTGELQKIGRKGSVKESRDLRRESAGRTDWAEESFCVMGI